jgi:hypothetical protein
MQQSIPLTRWAGSLVATFLATAASASAADPAAASAPPGAPVQLADGAAEAPVAAEPGGAGTAAVTSSFEAIEPPESAGVALKVYGDTLFQYSRRDPVKTTFEAAHIDLFLSADVGRLSFLSEVFFEGRDDNEIAVDVERLQFSYLFNNWLRVRAGRSHTAFGYYNDTFHHGNFFELTTERPFAVQFEDEGGLLPAHLVGVGIDGTFDAGSVGSFRYDLETGNGRLSDVQAVAITKAGKSAKLLNLRLRWLTPIDGFVLGVNGLHDVVPALAATATDPGRAQVSENIVGAHALYNEYGVDFLAEGYLIHHARAGAPGFDTLGGFVELGYTLAAFTPYIRPEFIHFPRDADPVFQGPGALWAGTRDLFDLRLGVRWSALPELVLKLEGERRARDGSDDELFTTKAAFGF